MHSTKQSLESCVNVTLNLICCHQFLQYLCALGNILEGEKKGVHVVRLSIQSGARHTLEAEAGKGTKRDRSCPSPPRSADGTSSVSPRPPPKALPGPQASREPKALRRTGHSAWPTSPTWAHARLHPSTTLPTVLLTRTLNLPTSCPCRIPLHAPPPGLTHPSSPAGGPPSPWGLSSGQPRPHPPPWLAPGTVTACATSRLWTAQHRGVHAAGVQENSMLLTKYHFEDRSDDLSQDDCIWSLRKQHPSKSHFKKVN